MSNPHNFWKTQPVGNDASTTEISHPKTISKISVQLPKNLKFTDLTIKNLPQIHNLLYNNYVEDENNNYRLNYSISFLKWQFEDPKILVGIEKDSQLVGFALGREHLIQINNTVSKTLSVNFLCLHSNLRKKNIAPLVIKEMTRRANLKGIYQAVFTAGLELPFKISAARYFHYVIDSKKVKEFEDLIDLELKNEKVHDLSVEEQKINYDDSNENGNIFGNKNIEKKENDLVISSENLKKEKDSCILNKNMEKREIKISENVIVDSDYKLKSSNPKDENLGNKEIRNLYKISDNLVYDETKNSLHINKKEKSCINSKNDFNNESFSNLDPNKKILPEFDKIENLKTDLEQIEEFHFLDRQENTEYTLLKEEDIEDAMEFINNDNKQYRFFEIYSIESFKHDFMSKKDVLYTIVSKTNNKITGLVSFFKLDTILISKKINLKCSYLYHLAGKNKTQLVTNAIDFCRKLDISMFNCLNLAKNYEFMGRLRFVPGDGVLNYYLFNWNCLPMSSNEISFFLP